MRVRRGRGKERAGKSHLREEIRLCRLDLSRGSARLRLLRLDSHLISGDLLVMLLAKHRDHIKCGAASQTDRDEFNWLRPGAAGRVIQQQVMATAGLGHKLPLQLKALSKFNLGGNHD